MDVLYAKSFDKDIDRFRRNKEILKKLADSIVEIKNCKRVIDLRNIKIFKALQKEIIIEPGKMRGGKAMDIVEAKKILIEKSSYIKETFYVKEIGIFGSFVKGKQKAKSDINILVTYEKGHKDFFNYMRLKYFLEDLLGRKVDLVIKEAVKPRLKQKIFNEVEYAIAK